MLHRRGRTFARRCTVPPTRPPLSLWFRCLGSPGASFRSWNRTAGSDDGSRGPEVPVGLRPRRIAGQGRPVPAWISALSRMDFRLESDRHSLRDGGGAPKMTPNYWREQGRPWITFSNQQGMPLFSC